MGGNMVATQYPRSCAVYAPTFAYENQPYLVVLGGRIAPSKPALRKCSSCQQASSAIFRRATFPAWFPPDVLTHEAAS